MRPTLKIKRHNLFLGRCLVLVVILLFYGGCRLVNRYETSKHARKAMHELLEHADGYDASKTYFDSLLEEAHDPAFDAAYRWRSRRVWAEFDGRLYVNELFEAMKERAENDEREEIVESLDDVWNYYDNRL